MKISRRGLERLVTVRDDGVGFEPEPESSGQGLGNMRRRGTALEVVVRA
ncbi:MAG: hypothetical protein WCH31_00030 [Actinomycetes bacterium]